MADGLQQHTMMTPDDADAGLQALVLVKLPSVLDYVGRQYLPTETGKWTKK